MKLKELLTRITKDVDTHARWLNSLSYLEYRGFRKIARSQRTEDIDEKLLTHAAEEVRHALYFKKLAIKVGGSRFSVYAEDTLLAEASVKVYFYDLDNEATLGSQDRKANYRLVTSLIEERAVGVYSQYEEVLREQGFDFTLTPVLTDEMRHLSDCRRNGSELESFLFQRMYSAFLAETNT